MTCIIITGRVMICDDFLGSCLTNVFYLSSNSFLSFCIYVLIVLIKNSKKH